MRESHSRRRWSRPRPPSCSGNHWGGGGSGVSTAPPGPPKPPCPSTPLLQHPPSQHPPPPARVPSAPPQNPASSWKVWGGETMSCGAEGAEPPRQPPARGSPSPPPPAQEVVLVGVLIEHLHLQLLPRHLVHDELGDSISGGGDTQGVPPPSTARLGTSRGSPCPAQLGWGPRATMAQLGTLGGSLCPPQPGQGGTRGSPLVWGRGEAMRRVWGGVSPRRPRPRWG